ncbi:MAG: PocR ligand-binding domain-containing protein [Clostridia bacterium]|nr:PocR ligand-binding domain-containing protein [Clostridia bacterium]
MIYYDVPLFSNLASHITTLTEASACFYTEDFQPTQIINGNTNPLCSFIKRSEKENCISTDTWALAKARDSETPYLHYYCHFGLVEMIVKLSANGVVYGYFLVGPFRESDKRQADELKIKSFCKANGINESEMLSAYNRVPLFTQEKFLAIRVLIDAIFAYAKQQNIVSLQDNLFDSSISPYLKNNLNGDLSLNSLCKRFYLTPKQLYNTFLKATGKPPKKYITEQRILKAKTLIVTTDLPLTQIAESVGIPDYNYFIKVFKSIDGHTPLFHRKTKIGKT